MMKIYDMDDYLNLSQVVDLNNFIKNMKWEQGIPGGFGTNTPKRKVNSFGDGATIDNNGHIIGEGLKKTYWTSLISASKYTLHTKTERMPQALANVVPIFRKMFLESYPNATITDNTFTLAVCNYYTEHDMYIAAHTDDNIWYPSECDDGCVFASLTLYPEGEPDDDKDLCRFQVKKDGRWTPVYLHDNNVLIMPGKVQHRVLPHTKTRAEHFKPRINITFRSCMNIQTNPLMHVMAVSNHTRYYRPPCGLTASSEDMTTIPFMRVLKIYNSYLKKTNKPLLKIVCKKYNRTKKRTELIQKLKIRKVTQNMVLETFQLVQKIIKKQL